MTDRIPDVSHYQGGVNWSAVIASGRAGGICKASEGTGYVDPTFALNWLTLGTLRAVRGAYHFARVDGNPTNQADKFLATVGPTRPGDLLILDLEIGAGNLSSWARQWLERVEERTGILPWFYSYAPFIRAHISDPHLGRYPLWLAAYTKKEPAAPAPWKAWTLWQYTNHATVPGIAGACDESVGNLRPATPAAVAPTPPIVMEVMPRMNPPIEIAGKVVDVLKAPTGGVWMLTDVGAVYAWECRDIDAPNRHPEYWGNRRAARLEAFGEGFAVTAVDGSRYEYG